MKISRKRLKRDLTKRIKVLKKRRKEVIFKQHEVEENIVRLKGLMEEEQKYTGEIEDGGHFQKRIEVIPTEEGVK